MNPLKWVSGKLNAGTAAVGRALIASWFRKVADGKAGPGAAKAYYWLSSHAAQITIAVGVLALALEAAAQRPDQLALVGLSAQQIATWAGWLAYAAPVLLGLKLITDQWHAIGHPDWLRSPWALWMKAHGAAISYLSAGAWWYAERCGAGGWCAAERWGIFLFGLFCAVTGIAPRADHSIPPAKVLEGLAGLIAAPTPAVAEQAADIAALPEANAAQVVLAGVAVKQEMIREQTPNEKATSVEGLKAVSAALDDAKQEE